MYAPKDSKYKKKICRKKNQNFFSEMKMSAKKSVFFLNFRTL